MPSAHTNSIDRNHVPGAGLRPSRLMLVGEAPGQTENALRIPFVGQAGEELNNHLLYAGLDRSRLYLTNLVKHWPFVDERTGKQLPPSAAEIARDEAELLIEINEVRPEIIVAIGAHAARYFLGDRFDSLFKCHGIPQVWKPGRAWRLDIYNEPFPMPRVVPVIHPAAALHSQSQEERARIAWDFQQVGKLVRGELLDARRNAFPEPCYHELRDADGGAAILSDLLAGATELALDTEGTIADPECVTLSIVPGEAWLVAADQPETLAALNQHINARGGICTVLCHYLGHDIPVLEALGIYISKHRAYNADGSLTLRCTMSEMYLLGGIEPKGLKPAIWRNCAMEQEEYADVVGPTEERNARGFIEQAFIAAQCSTCHGIGKAPEWRYIDPECAACGGSGRIAGKRANTTKWCDCAKLTDKCPDCIDGLRGVPMPDKELVFDKGQFRWKQPQSMARWMRRRLEKLPGYSDDEDAAEFDDDAIDVNSSEEVSGEDASAHFKLRRDWMKLSPLRRMLIEGLAGHMPRTKLFSVPDRARVVKYACGDSDGTLRLSAKSTERLQQYGLLRVRDIDAAVIPMIARMEQIGMQIDRPHFMALSADLADAMRATSTALSDLLGTQTNPNSPMMADVLFRELGLPVIKLTKTGARESIDDDVLSVLKTRLMLDDSPQARIGVAVCNHIQDYRELQKLKTTYADPVMEYADSADRIHCTINYARVATGRLSASDPVNLMTLPNPDNSPIWGKRVRDGIVARPGYKLIENDYSQIEMVFGAHLSQDPNLCMLLREGKDLHWGALSFIEDNTRWRELYDYFTADPKTHKPKRTTIKPVNFGAFYGLGPDKLQMTLASLPSGAVVKTLDECKDIIERYYQHFAPGVMEWKRRVWAQARLDGYVREPLSGRIRWMTGLRSDIKRVRTAAERECANMPVQGGAQTIIKIGMRRVWEEVLPSLWAEGIDAQVTMQNHDALLVEAPERDAEMVGWMIAEALRTAVVLSVPVKVSTKIGDRWGSL